MPIPDQGAEPAAWLTLSLIHHVSDAAKRKLLSSFGAPSAVLAAGRASLAAVVGDKAAEQICAGAPAERVDASVRWLEGESNHLVTLADDDYPATLLQTVDPPLVLYLKGRRELLGRDALAIVGSRNATPGGNQNAEAFAEALSHAGLTIISGMALGIDTAAHKGGLRGKGSTIAVVGTGLDLVYPARNKGLAHDLALTGLMLSEFSLGTPALPANFPRRNRIISGLSRGVLVVEAALASGSLITARLAAEQGRDVFAIPGSIHSPFSKGCHALIKQGAKLVDSAEDVLSELGLLAVPTKPSQAVKRVTSEAAALAESVNADEESPLLAGMGFDAVSIDALAERLDRRPETVTAELVALELEGRVASLPGGHYQRLS